VKSPKAGSVEWWRTVRRHEVSLSDIGEEPGREQQQRERQLHVIRPGERVIPDEPAPYDDDSDAWVADDFEDFDLWEPRQTRDQSGELA